MLILGISCYYHDAAAAIVQDGMIVAAAQEERFTRKKHDQNFPINAVEFCLKQAGCSISDVDFVAFYDKPFLKFERLLETYLTYAPKGLLSAWKGIPIWIKDKMWISDHICTMLEFEGKLLYPEHHQSHAASAFFPSPFGEAAVLTMDGVGEWASSSLSYGKDNKIESIAEQHFPHSLGLLYSAFTYFTGFRVNSGEYKLMGLAPYGNPRFTDVIYDKLIDLKDDGSFQMNQQYFNYSAGLTMTNSRFADLFGGPARKPESPVTQREMDLAASIQVVTEEIVLRSARFARQETGSSNLCLAGGVALNCVANGKIQKSGIFDKVWVQPSSGDAGGAVGAALFAWYQYGDNPRAVDGVSDKMQGSYLGPEFSNEAIETFLNENKIPFTTKSDDDLFSETARLLSDENVVGWFQGKMEFGPRALGNRSILGDPRSENMQKTLNVKIKFRESFRPFAPSVLADHTSEYFDFSADSPYMLMVSQVSEKIKQQVDASAAGFDKLYQKRSDLPAITHVDNSARIQTVHKETNPRYYRLIEEFQKITGVPVLINTSFNVRGEPIVCTPEDAYRCFIRTNMDVLVLGNHVLLKSEQPETQVSDEWKDEFALD
ncbi:MAG: carbamoyltransferase [Balneolales bacterium]|nr:carbamoyltransferase [Balneolales bacterium]